MRKMQDSIAAAALLLITDLTRISMTSMKHEFQVGDRVEMMYCYVVPRAYPGSVTRVTASSIHIQLDRETGSSRFSLRGRQWRSQFGHAVTITKSHTGCAA